MVDRNFEIFQFLSKFEYGICRGRWLRIRGQIFKKWRSKILKIGEFLWEFVYTVFLRGRFWIRCQIFEIQNGGSNMAEILENF